MDIYTPRSASDLYAVALGSKNQGKHACHWCGAAATDQWTHDDEPFVPFHKNKNRARHPASPYVCCGCWLWGRKHTTITFLDGTWKDRQWAANHSWWITPGAARAIRHTDHKLLYQQLLKPPHSFLLALVTPGTVNRLHCCAANDLLEIKAGTPLRFTLDGVPMDYTVHELEDALRNGMNGKKPGVQALVRYLGSYDLTGTVTPELPPLPKTEDRGRGRPWSGQGTLQDGKVLLKTVAKSGV